MKNYTSTVAPQKSINAIEDLLIRSGARQISKEYSPTGDVSAISFSIRNPETELPIYIRLPANPRAVFETLKLHRKSHLTRNQAESLMDQAKRTAWRLLWDWVAVQMSIVEMKQADLLQVFLPYVIVSSGGQTFYGQLMENKVAMLGYGKDERANGQANPA